MKNHGNGQAQPDWEVAHVPRYVRLLEPLLELQDALVRAEGDVSALLQQVHTRHRVGAANLAHYLTLRRRDMRSLQESLAAEGLSSLGRAESHVLGSLHAMIVLLQHALQQPIQEMPASVVKAAPGGMKLLEANTCDLLGNSPSHRRVRIMVTLPGETADDYALVRDMLVEGMDCARINCAHDGPDIWIRMIEQIRKAQRETGRGCRILMDLGGPKLRTGELGPGPAVMKWRPHRDAYGKVVSPARIWLYPESGGCSCPAPADVCIPVKGDWLDQVTLQDRIELTDTRGALRSMHLVGRIDSGFWAESSHTAYIRPGLKLHLFRISASGRSRPISAPGEVGAFAQPEAQIRLKRGDGLILTRAQIAGRPAEYNERGRLTRAAAIACSMPQIFGSVKPGERILIDDGRIGGVVRHVHHEAMEIEITQASDGGEKLLADKGINFPDSQLDLAGLTEQDIAHLEFISRHADMVGLSFARGAADVKQLQEHLQRLEASHLGIMLKIETRAAFEQLPEILFALLGSAEVGVMIARGDLAVECGYERLAELQEEILWLAEAAHLPVIWATQVLERLAKDGKPSRAEITDAAMGERAECVMLNKGPHIIEAIRTLDDILQRMQGHQQKKIALLRQLHW